MSSNPLAWPTRNLRVLWADDQIEVAKSLAGPIQSRGVEVDFVRDADAAVARLTSGIHHCVITDLQMPPGEWGGLDLLNWLHRQRSPVPVLVMSGEGGQRETIHAMRLGARDYVEKSKARTELLPALDRMTEDLPSSLTKMVVEEGPAPISFPFYLWQAESRADLRFDRAIRCAEAVLRWHAIVGLSEVARREQVVHGVPVAQLRAVSTGTWRQLCESCLRALEKTSAPGKMLRRLPYQDLQSVVRLRNEFLGHGNGVTEAVAQDLLAEVENTLAETYWRLMQGERPTLLEVEGLRYQGGSYAIVGRRLHGAVRPFKTVEVEAGGPAETGHAVNCWHDGTVTDLTPFASARTTGIGTDVLLLDGARSNRIIEPSTELSFRSLFTGEKCSLGAGFDASALLRVLD